MVVCLSCLTSSSLKVKKIPASYSCGIAPIFLMQCIFTRFFDPFEFQIWTHRRGPIADSLSGVLRREARTDSRSSGKSHNENCVYLRKVPTKIKRLARYAVIFASLRGALLPS